MSKTTNGKYELTASKNDGEIRTVMTTFHRTRKDAELAAHVSREWGWATTISRV